MKNLLLLLLCLCWLPLAQAQTPTGSLTLKQAQPKAGQEVRFTYNPAGTVLEKAASVTALVYAYDQNKPKAHEIELKKVKAGWEGRFRPEAGVDGAVLLFREEETYDRNNGKGYSFFLYDNKKQPVQGALYGLAAAYAEWGGMVGIENDGLKALDLLRQEAALYPAQKREMTQTRTYALSYAYKGEESKQKVLQELEDLSKEPNLTAKELGFLANYYNRLEQKDKGEAFGEQARALEPTGEFVQTQRLMEFYNTEDPAKKKELALAFAKEYPGHERVASLLSGIALEYAEAGNWPEFEGLLTKYPVLATSSLYNSAAWRLYEKGEDLTKAKALAQKGYELAQKEVQQPTEPKPDLYAATDWKKSREYTVGQVADTYGAILLKEGNKAAAEKYLAEGYSYTRGNSPDITERYAEVLASGGDKAKARKIMEEMAASGNGTAKVKGYLKDIYTQQQNGETGFEAYLAKVEAPALEKLRTDLKRKMILEAAPAFELRDLNGTVVSLASLKGKTVVVDFWATWCGPCVSSFPGMQQAVNKFKDNGKVAFVFVNSWESGKDKKKTAADFISKKNYSFQVLLDEENKMIDAYKVQGIPTKFILDANGNIRFKSVGFSGNSDKAVQEISTMIDLLRPELLTSVK
ncbi:redoxin domain-containing protein [Rufibacter hautae]|uniref:Redoxin domain-containing protein n=1 Tax=Rufibacter hautae TaxID=2595005 RepID=A0A5B6TVC0_9BACT|nr:redoxin domain-containing protein [Rufibacter hautae]KAA3440498.1 redoxin domain-containing protein [Rufibacter hautae]